MKVKELIEELLKLNQDAEVICSSYEEDNDYNLIGPIEVGLFRPKQYQEALFYRDGSVTLKNMSAEALREWKPAIVLGP